MALARLSTYTPTRRTAPSGSSGGSAQWLNNRGEPIPVNASGKPIYTPDPVNSPAYYAPTVETMPWTPEGYGPDQFGVVPGQLHRPVNQRPDERARTDAMGARLASKQQQMYSDPRWIAAQQAAADARAAGDEKAWRAANGQIMRAVDQIRRDNQWGIFHADPDAGWPVPASTNGQYWYRPPGAQGPGDPGQPGPVPPGVPHGTATPAASSRTYELRPSDMRMTQGPMSLGPQYGGLNPGMSSMADLLMRATGGGAGNPMMGGGYGQYGPRIGAPQEFMDPMQGPPAASTMSADMQRKLAQGMPPHLLGLPAGAASTNARTLPGRTPPTIGPGFTPGRPVPNPTPFPPLTPPSPGGGMPGGGGGLDYLQAMLAQQQMAAPMQGFQGMNALMMDPGMMAFGYRPTASNPFVAY